MEPVAVDRTHFGEQQHARHTGAVPLTVPKRGVRHGMGPGCAAEHSHDVEMSQVDTLEISHPHAGFATGPSHDEATGGPSPAARAAASAAVEARAAFAHIPDTVLGTAANLPPMHRPGDPTVAAALRAAEPFDAAVLRSGALASVLAYSSHLIARGSLDDNFYVMDLGHVARAVLAWRAAMPRVKPFYAVKCHPDPGVLAVMAAMGCGFDCASPAEIDLALRSGVDPGAEIIYAHPVKRPADLAHARRAGVQYATYDSPGELDKVKEFYPDMKMVLRIRADDPTARVQLGNKYGAEPQVWRRLLAEARARGLEVVGVSFHVGSAANDPGAYARAIGNARYVFEMGRELGFNMRLLDIGGGFCCTMEGGRIDVSGFASRVNAALAEHFPEGCGVDVIAEPGRYFTEHAGILHCAIVGRRPVETRLRGAHGGRWATVGMQYFLTDGVYGSFNNIVYDGYDVGRRTIHPLPASGAMVPPGRELPSTLFGPTCDGADTIAKGIPLPESHPGDYLAFSEMGAYSIAGATDFNGIKVSNPTKFYIFTLDY
ncbi:unnamed protein product [Pedinophyceae sp. YPF-701]|nr:unnamed protein product [Pedinophyceae sp. YPF-701]